MIVKTLESLCHVLANTLVFLSCCELVKKNNITEVAVQCARSYSQQLLSLKGQFVFFFRLALFS